MGTGTTQQITTAGSGDGSEQLPLHDNVNHPRKMLRKIYVLSEESKDNIAKLLEKDRVYNRKMNVDQYHDHLLYQKNYAEIKGIWNSLPEEEDAKLVNLKKDILDTEQAIAYQEEMQYEGYERIVHLLKIELEDAKDALQAYQEEILPTETRAQLIAYGKKRLAQIAALENHILYSGRRTDMLEKIEVFATEIQEIETSIGKQRELLETLEVKKNDSDNNKVLAESIQGNIDAMKEKIEIDEGALSHLKDKKAELEKTTDDSKNTDGKKGSATASENNETLNKLRGARIDAIKKLKMLGVPQDQIAELVLLNVYQKLPKKGKIRPASETSKGTPVDVNILPTDTGEKITSMKQLAPSRIGKEDKIDSIESIDNSELYIVHINSVEVKGQKRTIDILIKAVPGKPIEVLSPGMSELSEDGQLSVSIVGSGTTQRIIYSKQETRAADRMYTIYDIRGSQLGEVIGPCYMFDPFLDGDRYIAEISYWGEGSSTRGIMDISDCRILLDEKHSVHGGYSLKHDYAQQLVSERTKTFDKLGVGNSAEWYKNLERDYYIFASPIGGTTLCLVDKKTNKKLGYISQESLLSYDKKNQQVVGLVYKNVDGTGKILKIDTAPATCMCLPSGNELAYNVSLGGQISGNTAKALGVDSHGVFVKVDTGVNVFISHTGDITLLTTGMIQSWAYPFVCISNSKTNCETIYLVSEDSGTLKITEVVQEIQTKQWDTYGFNNDSNLLLIGIHSNNVENNLYYYIYDKISGKGQKYRVVKGSNTADGEVWSCYIAKEQDGRISKILKNMKGPDLKVRVIDKKVEVISQK